jgi:hypothetical protein
MLQAIAPDIWHAQHQFVVNGVQISSRMTVVRLHNGKLWLHSPIPLSPDLRTQVEALGQVGYIVAPSKAHHLFAGDWVGAYPQAILFGAPGLSAKRPDLHGMRVLSPAGEPEWMEELGQIFFEGIPFANETIWFHWPSRTLIVTDLCQWWQGELPLATSLYARVTGVRSQLAVPRTVRLITRDRQAARASVARILAWPIERAVLAHNAILEQDAHAAVARALAWF